VQIAKRHLVPKQLKLHGLTTKTMKLDDGALRAIISGYTRESGVRALERSIASCCRKAAKKIASGEAEKVAVKEDDVVSLLGNRKFKPEHAGKEDLVGVVNGLAWTASGGEILEAEVNILPGTGKLELTGNLGEVMKESARAAISYIRSKAGELGVDMDFHKDKDIHVHFPEGAVPKDGPSAGITVATAIFSALSGRPVRHEVAMTGEITLRGRVLPIGGLKEKSMAAYRYGIKTVIIPSDNVPDLADVDAVVKENVNFIPVDSMDAVLGIALICKPATRKKSKAKTPPPAVIHSQTAVHPVIN